MFVLLDNKVNADGSILPLLNLNINDFTISAWVQADALQTGTRTIMAKGRKLQLRLNGSHKIEVMIDNDDDNAPTFTSSMALNDNKWHQITFVYNSGTIFLYIDGVLSAIKGSAMGSPIAVSPFSNNLIFGAQFAFGSQRLLSFRSSYAASLHHPSQIS